MAGLRSRSVVFTAPETVEVREEAVHSGVTASGDTEEGKRRLAAWGFKEADGMWSWGKCL